MQIFGFPNDFIFFHVEKYIFIDFPVNTGTIETEFEAGHPLKRLAYK